MSTLKDKDNRIIVVNKALLHDVITSNMAEIKSNGDWKCTKELSYYPEQTKIWIKDSYLTIYQKENSYVN